MKTDELYQRIKMKCSQMNITISQLEKELGFGTGTIGKWMQSSPSIEKVMKVAQYFNCSLDELCGLKSNNSEEKIIEKLIQKTEEDMTWEEIELSLNKNNKRFGHLIQSENSELHISSYGELQFLLINDTANDKLALYVSDRKDIWKKRAGCDEKIKQLYEMIRQQEFDYDVVLNGLLENFLNS